MARKRNPHKRLHKGYMLSDIRLDSDSSVNTPSPPRSGDRNTPSSATKNESQPFRLLHLPSELLLKILDFACIHSTPKDPIHINSSVSWDAELSSESLRHGALSGRPYKKRKWALVQPAVARTCRLLRIEGLKIFYQKNFFFTDSSTGGIYALAQWLGCFEASHLGMITNLYVQWIQDIEHFDLDFELDLGELKWKHFVHEVDWILNHEEFGSLDLEVYFKRARGGGGGGGDGTPVMIQGFPTLDWSHTRMSRTKESPCYWLGVDCGGSERRVGSEWLCAEHVKDEERDGEEKCWAKDSGGES